jgi:hypothetical protein
MPILAVASPTRRWQKSGLKAGVRPHVGVGPSLSALSSRSHRLELPQNMTVVLLRREIRCGTWERCEPVQKTPSWGKCRREGRGLEGGGDTKAVEVPCTDSRSKGARGVCGSNNDVLRSPTSGRRRTLDGAPSAIAPVLPIAASQTVCRRRERQISRV